MEGEPLEHAENIHSAKRYIAHTYLSTKVDAEALFATFGKDVAVESFMKKAVQKAYKVVDPAATCDVNGTAGDHVIGLSNVSASQEALPICVPPTIMSVHYTPII